jgi:ribonucleoside-diphosphate reductase alpha chain/ribonucleoside-triphosphate reductase
MPLLSQEFLNQYPDNPEWPSLLGQFVYLRTYSRFVEERNRRESWKETVHRVVEYSMSLDTEGYPFALQQEAEVLFDAMFNLKVFPAGRTLWTGGTEAAKKYPLSNFNCSFVVVDRFESFIDAFYLMMLGTGVGFRVLPQDVAQLPKVGTLVYLENEYVPVSAGYRQESTTCVLHQDGSYTITVGDSKEGWVDGLRYLLEKAAEGVGQQVVLRFDYSHVRPAGEPLRTFGGRASGHEALRNMYRQIIAVIDEAHGQLSTENAMDIMNLIGQAVVVGGVRRSSEITLFAADDERILEAKTGLWTDPAKQSKRYRSMSNNSVFFTEKPTREKLTDIFKRIMDNGEPGFVNAEASAKRRPWYAGTNPCAEILLADNGVCNLSEVNMAAYVSEDGVLDRDGLMSAVALATRIGVRMATLELELPHWAAVQRRDRLTGVSITGYVEAMDRWGVDTTTESPELVSLLEEMQEVAHMAAYGYADTLGISHPLLVTCVKPSGTIAQLPTVSSGAHASYAPYYIRRVRISNTDPLARAMASLGFVIYPEAMYAAPDVYDAMDPQIKKEVMEEASTWVIEFPIKTAANRPSSSESAVEQLNRYFILQKYWSDHNTSITVTFSPEEVDSLIDLLLERWDDYIGVSFLPKHTGAYPLMPYEEIDEAEHFRRSAQIYGITGQNIMNALVVREGLGLIDETLEADCEGGACPIR